MSRGYSKKWIPRSEDWTFWETQIALLGHNFVMRKLILFITLLAVTSQLSAQVLHFADLNTRDFSKLNVDHKPREEGLEHDNEGLVEPHLAANPRSRLDEARAHVADGAER
jgi:hypothetical protein